MAGLRILVPQIGVRIPAPELGTRRKVSGKDLQVRVFRRDGWLCRWCGRPVVFAPAMRQLERLVRNGEGINLPAYYDLRWRRDRAPLLDHLGAVIDHVEAFSKGGAHDEPNFVTSCNKCNVRKNNLAVSDFTHRSPLRRVKGKYGEPTAWDGLSTLFIPLGASDTGLSSSEKAWLLAFGSPSHASLISRTRSPAS
jgi:5-methylcytosine-specific restriction endonuclease McrA